MLHRSKSLCIICCQFQSSTQNPVFWHFLYMWGTCNGTQLDSFKFHRSFFRSCPDVLTTIHNPQLNHPDVPLMEFGFRLGDKWHRREWCTLPSFISNIAKQGSLWGVHSSSVSQEIPGIIWKPRVHYHVHNSLPMVVIPSSKKRAQSFPSYFWKSTSILSYHLCLDLPSRPFPSRFCCKTITMVQPTTFVSHKSPPADGDRLILRSTVGF